MGSWGKLATLMISYASTIIVSLIVTIVLSSYGMIDYFGGDPEGSFEMLYIPSIVFYGGVGMVVIFGLKAIKEVKKRLSNAKSKTDTAQSHHAS